MVIKHMPALGFTDRVCKILHPSVGRFPIEIQTKMSNSDRRSTYELTFEHIIEFAIYKLKWPLKLKIRG